VSFENRGEAYGAYVIFTTRSGMVGHMDWGFSEMAQF